MTRSGLAAPTGGPPPVVVRHTLPPDFGEIIALTRRVYPESPPWSETQLASHLEVFPEGQFVAVEAGTSHIVGAAASLIVLWDDYDIDASWRDFTDSGMFTNHDPRHGRTLYGAEVMVDPRAHGRGIGTQLYAARSALVERLGLLRIRAGARLRNYHRHARELSADEYTVRVVRGELRDPTLSFQLARGFHVLDVVSNYLRHDPESLGFAAVIEWLNDAVARPEDRGLGDPKFTASAASRSSRGENAQAKEPYVRKHRGKGRGTGGGSR